MSRGSNQFREYLASRVNVLPKPMVSAKIQLASQALLYKVSHLCHGSNLSKSKRHRWRHAFEPVIFQVPIEYFICFSVYKTRMVRSVACDNSVMIAEKTGVLLWQLSRILSIAIEYSYRYQKKADVLLGQLSRTVSIISENFQVGEKNLLILLMEVSKVTLSGGLLV